MSLDAIKKFSEEKVINNIQNNYDSSSVSMQGNVGYPTNTFNPIEKLVEVYSEKEKLFERMLKMEREKIKWLEEMLRKK